MADMTSSEEETSTFQKRMNDSVLSGFIAAGLALGRKLGLFEAFGRLSGAITSTQLADQANCKERYVREWLHHMVLCDVVDVDDTGKLFTLPEYRQRVLTDPQQLVSSVSTLLPVMFIPHQELLQCFDKNGPNGIPFETVKPYLTEYIEICKPDMYTSSIQSMKDVVEGLEASLESGIRVCEVGAGSGELLIHLATAYPNSTFVGLDLNTSMLEEAKANISAKGLKNVQLHLKDVIDLPEEWSGTFDYFILRDVLHDLARPDSALECICRCLKPGGQMSVFDINISENMSKAKSIPSEKMLGQIVLPISLYHCLAASLNVPGSMGLGNSCGKEALIRLMQNAGFNVSREPVAVDMVNVHIVAQKHR